MSDVFQVAPCTPSRHCATRGAVTHYTPPPMTDRERREERRADRDRAMTGRYIRVRKDGRESWVGPMLREEAEAYLRQHGTGAPCRLEKGGGFLRPTWENADARIEREHVAQQARERARREAREQAEQVARERREQAERQRQQVAPQREPAREPARQPARPEPQRAPAREPVRATPTRREQPVAVPARRPDPARTTPPPARVEPRAVPTHEPLRITLPSVRLPSVRWAGAPVMGAAGAVILLAPAMAILALIGVAVLSLPTIVFALPFAAIAVVGIAAALTERAQRPHGMRPRQVRAEPAPAAVIGQGAPAPALHVRMPRAVAPATPAPMVRAPRPAPRIIGAPVPAAIPEPQPVEAETLAEEFVRHAMRVNRP